MSWSITRVKVANVEQAKAEVAKFRSSFFPTCAEAAFVAAIDAVGEPGEGRVIEIEGCGHTGDVTGGMTNGCTVHVNHVTA